MSVSANDGTTPKRQEPSIDRISDLPDNVITHILSFLPTRAAFATSVLSSKWRSIWRDTSNLSFCYDERRNNAEDELTEVERFWGFVDFVNRVLLLHKGKCLDKFSLEIRVAEMMEDDRFRQLAKSWVEAAIDRNVKHLVLSGSINSKALDSDLNDADDLDLKTFLLPSCIFTSESLVSLHLSVVNLNPKIGWRVCLPNLRSLRLEDVYFQRGAAPLEELLYGCSSLQTLYVSRSVYDNAPTLSINSPTLEHLTIKMDDEFDTFMDPMVVMKLELDAPALKYFSLDDAIIEEYSVEALNSLDEAHIRLDFLQREALLGANGIDSLFHALTNVKILYLKSDASQALSYLDVTPEFQNLTKLNFGVSCCCEWSTLEQLLEGTETLEVLIFNINGDKELSHDTCWIKPERVPRWIANLKVMSIEGFEDRDGELRMVAYILQHARLLETMRLTVSDFILEEKPRLFRKISKLPRRSKHCEIIYAPEDLDD